MIHAITRNNPAATAVAPGESTVNTPAATATPLPPWNRSQTGIDVTNDRGRAGERDQRGAACEHVRDRHRTDPLRDVQRHDDDAAPRTRRAEDVGRADVAAAGNPHVDAFEARQQERERHGAGQVSQEDREHYVNGTRSRGSYAAPDGEVRLRKTTR